MRTHHKGWSQSDQFADLIASLHQTGRRENDRPLSEDENRLSAMIHSVDHFLTTHVGSLPRPEELIQIMYAKEEGKPVDRLLLTAKVRAAVAAVVAKQRKSGIAIVSDGEMSKPSYATYVKDRLAGFGGTGNTFVYQDLVDFPNLAKRVFSDPGRSRRKTPACNGPITVADAGAVRADVENLRAAVGDEKPGYAFVTAASPGVISLFFRNDYYPSQDAYLEAIATAMRSEYETIVAGGFDLQVDCPDLASHPSRRLVIILNATPYESDLAQINSANKLHTQF